MSETIEIFEREANLNEPATYPVHLQDGRTYHAESVSFDSPEHISDILMEEGRLAITAEDGYAFDAEEDGNIVRLFIEERERKASGLVMDEDTTITKSSYQQRNQMERWKVAVSVDGNLSTKQEAGLSAQEADELFESLCQKYNLEEE